jgi:hypothetical protein
MPIQFQFNREVDNDFINALMNQVADSPGIGGWANPDFDSQDEFKTYDGVYLMEIRILVDEEPVPGFDKQQTITGMVLHDGIARLLNGDVDCNARHLGDLLYAVIHDDMGDIDDELLDSIVQAGLYNDIKFA